MFTSQSAFSQTPASCGDVNCTSNDVRVISAYISGAGNIPIDCGVANPFATAELHLIIFSNTQRIGVSISGTLNVNGVANPFANCFTGKTLNAGGNNNLVLSFPLPTAICGDGFSLTNLFVSWGVGNKDFCDGSTDGHCPETKAKCRFVPGEEIPVPVKLEVDFSWTAGVCSNPGGDSKTFEFIPELVTAKNIVYPVTFTWDFGDGSPTETTTAASLADVPDAKISHTYANEGNYSVTLVGSDASPSAPVFSVTSIHIVSAVSCCNLNAPTSGGDQTKCATSPIQTLTASATGSTGETITWFDAATDGNEVASPTLSAVGTVTYYAEASTSNCVSPTRTAVTLTINALPTVNCPGNSTVCISAAAYALTGATPAGGTYSGDGVSGGNFNPATAGAGPHTITYTYTDANTCSNTCTFTITVRALPTVNCPGNSSVCISAAAYALTGATPAGGTYSGDGVSGGNFNPATAGVGPHTITYTYTDANTCSNTCTFTITVKALPTVSSITVGAQTCDGGVAKFALSATTNGTSFVWSKSAGADGTFSSTTTSLSPIYTPGNLDKANGVTITLTATLNGCTNSASVVLRPTPCGPYYTYTQGYYSGTGASCTPVGGVKGSVLLIQYALDHMNVTMNDGIGQLNLGKSPYPGSGASFIAKYAEASKLMAIMPGGGTAAKLTKDYNLTANNFYPPLKNGKIDNVLLSQTITLALNIHIQGDGLGAFVLQPGYLTTQKGDLSTCPTTKVVACSKDATSISSLKITANNTLMTLLTGKTVTDLLNIASAALGGVLPAGVTSYADISGAVDVINKSFDAGRFFLGYYATQQSCSSLPLTSTANPVGETITTRSVTKLVVSAYPNPFNNKVRFTVESPASGQASLEVFNILGQKVKTVFKGHISAGIQIYEMNVPIQQRSALVYIFRLGDKRITGKLLHFHQ